MTGLVQEQKKKKRCHVRFLKSVFFFLGFGCSCAEHSVPVGIGRCKPCNATEVVSVDGDTCVPRRCQNVSGRIACRKCPNDYITG